MPRGYMYCTVLTEECLYVFLIILRVQRQSDGIAAAIRVPVELCGLPGVQLEFAAGGHSERVLRGGYKADEGGHGAEDSCEAHRGSWMGYMMTSRVISTGKDYNVEDKRAIELGIRSIRKPSRSGRPWP